MGANGEEDDNRLSRIAGGGGGGCEAALNPDRSLRAKVGWSGKARRVNHLDGEGEAEDEEGVVIGFSAVLEPADEIEVERGLWRWW